jgi:hypothetical protein
MAERLYEWQDPKTGEYVEEFFDVDTVPRIGEFARVRGRRLRRIPSIPDFAVEPDFGSVLTHQFSDEDCARFGPKDRNGQPRKLTATGGLQLNGRERADFEAKMADAGRTVRYDTGMFRNKKRKEVR